MDSGTYDYFTQAIVGKEGASRGDFTSSEDDNVLVQGIANDELAIGFMPYAYYIENQAALKLVPVDDGKADNGAGPIQPSVETVKTGTYQPLSRPVFIYASVKALERPEVAQFVDYYLTQGGALAEEVGYVPLGDRGYQLVRGALHRPHARLGLRARRIAGGPDHRAAPPARDQVEFAPCRRVRGERIIESVLLLCALLSVGTTAGIIVVLAAETFAFLREVPLLEFLTGTEWTPLFANPKFGVLPLLIGTTLVSAIALVVAVPTGLLSAIYLSEYAPDRARRVVKPVLEILAGVPTVVYGYFALTFVTPLLQQWLPGLSGFNALSPGIVMGIMILPLVSSLSEDAMQAVPRGLREGAYALGATRMQTAVQVVVPAAFSGITAAVILAASRAIGETMIVAIAAGQQPRFTANPFVPIETMTAYIVQVSLGDTPQGTLEYRTIFAVGMLLFLMTFALNLVSTWLRERFREEYN